MKWLGLANRCRVCHSCNGGGLREVNGTLFNCPWCKGEGLVDSKATTLDRELLIVQFYLESMDSMLVMDICKAAGIGHMGLIKLLYKHKVYK